MKSNEVMTKLQKIEEQISTLLFLTCRNNGEYNEDVEYDNTPEELFLKDEFYIILEKLDQVKREINYLKRPIECTGTLTKNKRNYYETDFYEWHAGNSIEALIYDEYNECYKWVLSNVEFDTDYYIVGYKSIPMDGLTVRKRVDNHL